MKKSEKIMGRSLFALPNSPDSPGIDWLLSEDECSSAEPRGVRLLKIQL
jgi:hypothetical protein